jgi:hypothetical protein
MHKMSPFRLHKFLLAMSLISIAQIGPAPGVWAKAENAVGQSDSATPVKYPSLISATSTNVCSGKSTLPFILSLAQHPELLQPPYLRMILGTPDRAKPFAYPSNNFTWTPADGTRTTYALSRITDSRPPCGGETRQLVVSFKHSSITQKSLRSRLGKPIRRYFDNSTQPVDLYQISPGTTLAVTEPPNSFDVSQLTVCYSGPYLPQASKVDMAEASYFRQKQIDHHLSKGNHERGLALLQEHVGDNPQDIESHIVLAQALRNRCDINGSIAEYRRALALAQASGDTALQQKALNGLAPIGLVPPGTRVVKPMTLQEAAQGGSIPF